MLSATESAIVEKAVAAAETRTRAEIVVCILRASSEDRGIACIGAMIAAGAAFLLIDAYWPEAGSWTGSGIATLLGVVVFVAMDWFDLGLKLLPSRLTARHARRAARSVFLDRGLDALPERNAVLLFVSRAERYVEILPDRGLAERLPEQSWASIVALFREVARSSGLAAAAAEAVRGIGDICAKPYPAEAGNPNLTTNAPITEPDRR